MFTYLKKNAVTVIAFFAAVITSFFVPPDENYLNYFDYKTLVCLFCVLAVVRALKHVNFFYMLARKVVNVFKTTKMCILALVYITFIGSMLIANDMALLTFLPLGFIVLKSTGKQKNMAFTFIMQNIAANLGGMLTPFGNPQNLYLYSAYNIPNVEFLKIMAPPFLLAVALITLCCLLVVPSEPLEIEYEKICVSPKKVVLYLILFAISILIVFRGVSYIAGLVIIVGTLFFVDRKALKKVDYPLLLTFVFFFIFSGNMARIGVVRELFSSLLDKNTLIFSVLSCQIISNVPTSILFSQFTQNYADLLVGVNIGGVGTLISSLASLITFRQYVKHNPGKQFYYIKLFSLYNFGFLAALTAFMLIYR